MPDPKDVLTKKEKSVIRLHSPYCEATGPIVNEGTVAARVIALQEKFQVEKLGRDLETSHTPLPGDPPCALGYAPDLTSARNSLRSIPGDLLVRKSQSRLANHVQNAELKGEKQSLGRVLRRSSFTVSRSLGSASPRSSLGGRPTVSRCRFERKSATEGTRGGSQGGSTRKASWKQTIKDNAAFRLEESKRQQIRNGPWNVRLKEVHLHEDAPVLSEPIDKPTLKSVPLVQVLGSKKPQVKAKKSIAEQLADMIDRALEGRDTSTTPRGKQTISSSKPTEVSLVDHDGEFDHSVACSTFF